MARNPIDTHVGTRVRLRRLELGITQQELARHIGVTFQQVQKYERGVNRISASKLFAVSRLFNVDVQFFFEGMGAVEEFQQSGFAEDVEKFDEEAIGQLMDFISSHEGLELNRAFANIQNQSIRRNIAALIEMIADRELAWSFDLHQDED